MMSKSSSPGIPWYRQGWPWILLAIPASSVVLGFVMLYLALNSNNSLVVDDYYKEGKAINQRIVRDAHAAVLGVHASVHARPRDLALSLRFVPPPAHSTRVPDASGVSSAETMPPAVTLRWVHVTEASLDGEARLHAAGHGRFIGDGVSLPAHGRYRVHVEPSGGDWRLVSELLTFERPGGSRLSFDIAPPPLERFDSIQ